MRRPEEQDDAVTHRKIMKLRKRNRLTRYDQENGAWECCGYVHVADLKTCPICGRTKGNKMTTTVKVHVNGQYRATVKQDGRDPVTVEGNYNGGTGEAAFYLPHPAKATFEISEEYVKDDDKRPAA